MITEDYVSFEIAKLLKEKGFDEATYQFYKAIAYLGTEADDICLKTMDSIKSEPFYNSYYGIDLHGEDTGEYACPTLQMVMKWLREVHSIDICIGKAGPKAYTALIVKNNISYPYYPIKNKDAYQEFPLYEEACEAAIKYCLEHLI